MYLFLDPTFWICTEIELAFGYMKSPVLKKIWKHEHECNIQGNQGFWKGPWNHTFKYAGGIDYFCSVLTVIAFTDKRRDKWFEGGQTREIQSLCSLKISSGLYWLSFPDLYVMFITICYHHHLMSYIFLNEYCHSPYHDKRAESCSKGRKYHGFNTFA